MATNAPRTAAKDRVYRYVKERILDGLYPGGELLSEGEVAEALAVSRTPVREAFLLLEAEGLMRLYPKRGALVVPVSPEEVRDVMETRLMVETHAAGRVAALGEVGRGLRDELRALCDRQEALLEAGDLPGFVDADRAFHHAMVAAAGNVILTRLHDSLRDRQRRMVTATVRREPETARRYLGEHRTIIDALDAGDGEGARRRLDAHLRSAWVGIEHLALTPP